MGPTRTVMQRGEVKGVMMPNPKDVRIAELEAQLALATAARG
jgi:hypothetical protein